MTSPDYQIVKFTMFNVSYLYTGSSGRVLIVSGKEQIPIKKDIEEALKEITTQHIPANEQIISALTIAGYRLALPTITYLQSQPEDTLPEGAIS